jgi:hypothetical protein
MEERTYHVYTYRCYLCKAEIETTTYHGDTQVECTECDAEGGIEHESNT